MSEQAPQTAAPEAQPETVSKGTAGDPSAPTLGGAKPDWVGAAMAKLSEVQASPGAPEPEPNTAADPPPEPAAGTTEGEPAVHPAQTIADAIAAGQAPAAAPEKEPALDESDPKLAASIAKLVELEQASRAEQRKLAEERRTLEAERQRLADLAKARDAFEQSGSKLAALQAMGWSYEDLTAEAIKGTGGTVDLGPVTGEIEALRKQLDEQKAHFEAQLQEREQKAIQAQEQAWRQEHAAKLKAAPDRWGLLTDGVLTQGRDPVEMVLEVIQGHWVQSGQSADAVLPFEEAADILEASLEQRARQLAATQQQSKLHRILGLTAPTAAPDETSAPNDADRSPDAPVSTTLTPALASRSPANPDDGRKLTPQDYQRRAMEKQRQLLGQ